jgi:DNA transformation protein and related proteins
MSSGFQDFLADLFEPLDGVSFRRMFGGIGIFREGLMFALVADDTLYLKADDATASDFKAEGCAPFVYDGKDRPVALQYWRLPERLYDDPDAFRQWALTAFAVAERARAKKPKRKPRSGGRKTDT